MNLNYVLLYFTIVFVNIFHILGYRELSNSTLKIKNINFIILFLFSFFIMFNSLSNTGLIKPIISFICLCVLYFFFFGDKYNRVLSYGILNYVIALFIELILSIVLILFKIPSYESFNENMIIKSIFSISVIIITYFLCKISLFKKFGNKLSNLIDKSKIVILFLILILFVPIILDFKYLNNINSVTYVMNIVLFIIFDAIVLALIYYENKINIETQKYENLLNFVSKYEEIIDEQRIAKHEIHNNLLILKSFDNKNSDKFNYLLDEFITYYSKTTFSIKNMNKLPSGIKGILYYKIMNIDENRIKINVNISKQVNFNFLKDNGKEYFTLCKVLGIILDNAIEAAENSTMKQLIVEAFNENNSIKFIVSNTFNDKNLKIEKINNIYYSSKGNGRGLGLYIARRLLNSSKFINMNQFINDNYFITEIIIDNKNH